MSEAKSDNREKLSFLISVVLGSIASFVFVRASVASPDSAIGIASLGNIKTYVIAVLVWLMVSVAAFPILRRSLPAEENKVLSAVITAAASVFFLVISFEIYQFLSGDKRYTPKYLIALFLYVIGTVVIYSRLIDYDRLKTIKTAVIVIEIAGFAALWFLSCCYMNTFTTWSFGTMYNVFHSSSYIDSIVNIYFGHPFRGLESELYGHYALFFILPLKLFGANMRTIGLFMGSLAAITYISLAVSLVLSVKQFIIKITSLAVLGVSGILAVSMYWMSFPHRMIFPALTILALTLIGRRGIKSGKVFAAGLILTTCAVIWNLESGILCAVAWGISGCVIFGRERNRLLSLIVSEMVTVISSCALALAVLNIFNRSRGGFVMGLKALTGYMKSAGHIASISSPIAIGNAEYIHTVMICMVCALWGAWQLIIKHNDSSKVMFALSTSIFGIGIITYYVNDSEGGPAIFLGYCVLVASVLASGIDSKKDLYSVIKKAACIYACTALFTFGAMNRNYYKNIFGIRDSGAWDYKGFREFALDMDSRIAPDTVAEGYGVSALFLEMGRDDGTDDFRFCLEDVEGADHFIKFWSEDTEFEGYEVVDHFVYGDTNFGYYERIPDEEV